MKNVIKYLNVFIGCALIAFALDFIVIPNNLVTFGFNGLSALIYYINGINPAINILILNLIGTLIALLFVPKEIVKNYLVPSILIPVLVFVFSFFTKLFVLELPEMMLVIIVAGVLTGYGYSMIFKQGLSASIIFLLEEIIGNLTKFHSKIYSWMIDIVILIAALILLGYHAALYSLIIIIISKYMITKTRFGINDSKVFYIITSKEKEIKHFILHDLKYELTVLDVKGGFSKKKNEILLCVINANDYYKLKEGIKIIDSNAFIAICDTYDVVNQKSF